MATMALQSAESRLQAFAQGKAVGLNHPAPEASTVGNNDMLMQPTRDAPSADAHTASTSHDIIQTDVTRTSDVVEGTSLIRNSLHYALTLRAALFALTGTEVPDDDHASTNMDEIRLPAILRDCLLAVLVVDSLIAERMSPATDPSAHPTTMETLDKPSDETEPVVNSLIAEGTSPATDPSAHPTTMKTSDNPSDETELVRILRTADTMVEGGMEGILENYVTEGTYLGREMLQLFIELLYGQRIEDGTRQHHCMDSVYAMLATLKPVSHMYRRTQLLVDFIQEGRGDNPVHEFTARLRGEWDLNEQQAFSEAWDTFWHAIGFPVNIELCEKATFAGQIRHMYPKQPVERTPGPFPYTLLDLESVDLVIKPTDLMNEHLQLEGDTVKVLCLNDYNVFVLGNHHHNKVVKMLGIEKLGDEILATLNILYGKDQLYRKAQDLDLYKMETVVARTFAPTVIDLAGSFPRVLAHRVHVLEKLVRRRRSVWRSFHRDTKRQYVKQPFAFFGALPGVIFGIPGAVLAIAFGIFGLLHAIGRA